MKALLDHLRASQAWQQTIGVTPPSTTSTAPESSEPSDVQTPIHNEQPSPSSFFPPATVASLLSQLTAHSTHPTDDSDYAATSEVAPTAHALAAHTGHPHSDPSEPANAEPSITSPVPSSARKADLRSSTFQQALPHLARLAEDTTFVSAVTAVGVILLDATVGRKLTRLCDSKMKNDQNDLERRLFDERRAIQKAQQEKVKKALTKYVHFSKA